MELDDSYVEEMREKIKGAEIEWTLRVDPGKDEQEQEKERRSIIGREPAEGRYDVDVRLLALSEAFAVELRISSPSKTKYELTRRYIAGDAKSFANKIDEGDAESLVGRFDEEMTEKLSDDLRRIADLAERYQITEMVGRETIDAYQDGQITFEEMANKYESSIDEMFS